MSPRSLRTGTPYTAPGGAYERPAIGPEPLKGRIVATAAYIAAVRRSVGRRIRRLSRPDLPRPYYGHHRRRHPNFENSPGDNLNLNIFIGNPGASARLNDSIYMRILPAEFIGKFDTRSRSLSAADRNNMVIQFRRAISQRAEAVCSLPALTGHQLSRINSFRAADGPERQLGAGPGPEPGRCVAWSRKGATGGPAPISGN